MGKKPVNVKEGLTRGGKGLLEVELLPNVLISKFAVNTIIVLFVCQLLHYYHSKRDETILQPFEIVCLDPSVSSERDGQASEI